MTDESSRVELPRAPRVPGLAAHALVAAVLAMAVARVWLRAPGESPVEGRASELPRGEVVASVGDEVVTAGQLEVRWNDLLTDEKRRFHRERGGPADYLQEVVDEILLAREARRRGYADGLAVKEAIRRESSRALSRALLADEVRARAIAESEVRAYYDAHVADWGRPLRVNVSEILVRAGGDRDAARATAEDLRRRAASGEDFAALARASSEAPTAQYGGTVGWVAAGQFAEAYEAAALVLRPGEISDVLETPDGFVILRASAREESTGPTFEEKRAEIVERLLEEDPGALQRRYNVFLEVLRREDPVRVDEAALARLEAAGQLRP